MRALWTCLLLAPLLASCHSSGGRPHGEWGAAEPVAALGRATGSAFDDAAAAPPFAERLRPSPRAQVASLAGAAAEPEASALEPTPSLPREVIYTASLRLVVVSIEDATRAVQRLAEEAGGHLQHATSQSITIRVPAAKFDASLERIAALGEVTDRSIDATDVTEQMLDLNIRLDNAKKTRERLLEHLARSQKIADTLKIEQELARVSETIEQLEGRLRLMRSQVAMSTITVVFTARTPAQPATALPLGLPFPWIEALGDGLVAGAVEPVTREPGFFDFPPKLEPPTDFLRYYTSHDRVEALSADGLRIKLRRHENPDRGTLAFWQALAREQLVRGRGVAIAEERALGDERALLRGTRELGGRRLGYLLVLKRTKGAVYTFEAWGPENAFDARIEALVESAKSI
ncbi:MAG: DUF4349 domain-containing protein [Myxococcota bacterium]